MSLRFNPLPNFLLKGAHGEGWILLWLVWSLADPLPLRTFTIGSFSQLRFSGSGSGYPPFCISQKSDVWRHSILKLHACVHRKECPELIIDMTQTWPLRDLSSNQLQVWIDWAMPVLVEWNLDGCQSILLHYGYFCIFSHTKKTTNGGGPSLMLRPCRLTGINVTKPTKRNVTESIASKMYTEFPYIAGHVAWDGHVAWGACIVLCPK